MTLHLLHEEYRQSTGAASYSYTQFYRDYRKFVASRKLVMRQTHTPDDKLFVDFFGLRPAITDGTTGGGRIVCRGFRRIELHVSGSRDDTANCRLAGLSS
jgi:hypothetical protein